MRAVLHGLCAGSILTVQAVLQDGLGRLYAAVLIFASWSALTALDVAQLDERPPQTNQLCLQGFKA